jgi:hypothetical protein
MLNVVPYLMQFYLICALFIGMSIIFWHQVWILYLNASSASYITQSTEPCRPVREVYTLCLNFPPLFEYRKFVRLGPCVIFAHIQRCLCGVQCHLLWAGLTDQVLTNTWVSTMRLWWYRLVLLKHAPKKSRNHDADVSVSVNPRKCVTSS